MYTKTDYQHSTYLRQKKDDATHNLIFINSGMNMHYNILKNDFLTQISDQSIIFAP